MSKQVLILGSQGHFGAAAAAAFSQAGWRVLCHARRPDAALPAGARRVDTPLTDTDALGSASGGQCPGHPRRQRALPAMGARGAAPGAAGLCRCRAAGCDSAAAGQRLQLQRANAFAPVGNSGADTAHGQGGHPRGHRAASAGAFARRATLHRAARRATSWSAAPEVGWARPSPSPSKTASWSTPAAWTPPTPGRICRTWPAWPWRWPIAPTCRPSRAFTLQAIR
jgi:hypothetical protein